MRVVFTLEAEGGLEAIGDYIANDNPRRAMTFVAELRSAALGLADHPYSYPLAPRYERQGVRRRVHGDYLILYRVEADRVVVLRVVHGARDRGGLISPDE